MIKRDSKYYILSKNGRQEIYRLLERLDWSVIKLSKNSGIHFVSLYNILYGKKTIGEKNLSRIQKIFGEQGLYFDVCEAVLDKKIVPFFYDDAESEIDFVKMDEENMAELKNGLQEREKLILDMKYDGKSYTEIGGKINRTLECSRQITFMALNKLKKAGGF